MQENREHAWTDMHGTVVVPASAAQAMRETLAPLAARHYREGSYAGADPDDVEALVNEVADALGLDPDELGAEQYDALSGNGDGDGT